MLKLAHWNKTRDQGPAEAQYWDSGDLTRDQSEKLFGISQVHAGGFLLELHEKFEMELPTPEQQLGYIDILDTHLGTIQLYSHSCHKFLAHNLIPQNSFLQQHLAISIKWSIRFAQDTLG